MANQYEVLGKAPTPEDLKKLSPNEIHLTIKNLNAGYGKMEILHNFDLFVNKAQSLCLIGPNGAGKSTILHSIYGFTNIFSGQIEIEGKEITNLSPAEKLKSCGIAYILQDNSVFPEMTVEENKNYKEYDFDEVETVEEYFDIFWNDREALEHLVNLFLDQIADLQEFISDRGFKEEEFLDWQKKKMEKYYH